MPASVVKSKYDEKMWEQAKAAAKAEGREKDWKYVMAIFEHMRHGTGSKPYKEPKAEAAQDPRGEAAESPEMQKREMLASAAKKMLAKGGR